MANLDNTGFRPADRKPSQELMYDVDSGSGTNMFVGDVVSAVAAGAVNPATADDGAIVVGVVVGLFDSNGISIGSPQSLVSTKYLPLSTAGKALVALALPGRRFIAQGQTGQTPTSADIWSTTDHVAGAGSTVTARSGHELDLSDLNSGAQCLIVGEVKDPNNSFGANVDLYVTFNEGIFMGVGKAVGV